MTRKEVLAQIKIVEAMANEPGVKQLCKIIAQWIISKDDDSELGFTSKTKLEKE